MSRLFVISMACLLLPCIIGAEEKAVTPVMFTDRYGEAHRLYLTSWRYVLSAAMLLVMFKRHCMIAGSNESR
jgi:hypothetical protein